MSKWKAPLDSITECPASGHFGHAEAVGCMTETGRTRPAANREDRTVSEQLRIQPVNTTAQWNRAAGGSKSSALRGRSLSRLAMAPACYVPPRLRFGEGVLVVASARAG